MLPDELKLQGADVTVAAIMSPVPPGMPESRTDTETSVPGGTKEAKKPRRPSVTRS